ncbi:MAG TPA: ABC transporter permease [Bryobacteraceae bacterium]|nr:ABC transporter permease [Bryobacteraceae bacterium]
MRREDDFERELRDHLELEAEELRASGIGPREAQQAARRTFGNPTQIKENVRAMARWTSLERLFQDLKYGARLLRRSPGFSIVAILTLALGIGANSAIFSVVNGILLRPLPFRDPGRLVRLWPASAKTGPLPYGVNSYPDFTDWKAASQSFEQVEGYVGRSFNLIGGDQPQRVTGLRTSGGFLPFAGVSPILGRGFTANEIARGEDHLVLLAESLWQSRFARDPGILGKTVQLNEETFTVIGVVPATFQFPPDHPADMVLPQPADPSRGHGFFNVAARLKPGVSLAEAQAEMNTITERMEAQYPKENKDKRVRLIGLQESYVSTIRPALMVFLGAVGFVLLIACANVANLFLSRTAGRQKELVVRAAMGAGRLRLIRQMLTESALIGLAGGAVGLLLAYWSVKGLTVLIRSTFATAAMDSVSMDGTVLGFTLGIALLVGLVAGLAPALGASRLDLNDTLKEGSRGLTGNRRRSRIHGALVVAEMALALLLLIGAGLMLKSLVILNNIDAGVHEKNVLAMNFSLGGKKYAKTQARAPFVDGLLRRVEQVPGVRSAAVVTNIPLGHDNDALAISIEGRPDPPPSQKPIVRFNVIGPGYLRTLEIPLLKGRDFSARDAEATPMVVMINQAMARKFWPNEDPLGRRISTDGQHWLTITGVTGDVRQNGLRADPQPEVYVCYLQDPYAWPYLSLLARTATDPMKLAPAIQGAIWSMDKDLPIAAVTTMEQIRSGSIAQPRLTALLLGVFAFLALTLATVGIYGVMAHSVSQRTHEMGLRMALGARSSDVLRAVVGQGMALAGCGVALGLLGAFGMTRLLAKFLWSVRPTDPLTFAAVSLLLMGVALLACYVPARRATSVDPMVALRYE